MILGRCLCLALLLAGWGCIEESKPIRGIQTRLYVDRTEARVGDPVGVTIEIETPEGFTLELPASPPSDERFFTEHIERLDPVWIPGGLRHRLLWTLRARSPGDHHLPELGVPLAWPDQRVQRLPVGSVPLPVRSVRAELPDQEAYFDIRPPPPLERRSLWTWIAAGGGLLAVLVGFLLYRRKDLELTPQSGPAVLARETLARLEAGLGEEDPRTLATRSASILRRFAGPRWGILGDAWTPEELPDEADPSMVSALLELESVRFARVPRREAVLDASRIAQTYLSDVARLG